MIRLQLAISRKTYNGNSHPVLSNINLDVEPGQFVALVGPSGAGKTTLLNMVVGLEPSLHGEIRYDGTPIKNGPDCRLGYIFQQPRLMPWLTVYQNLRLVQPTVCDQAISALLEQVGLHGQGDAYPRQLSGGMQRRVSIARAFLGQPELLLLDEPFISLDQPNATRLRTLLEDLWLRHRPTVIFVTHNLSEAIRMADRVVFLSSSPATIIHDQPIALSRPRKEGGSCEHEIERGLLDAYPKLLEGRLGSDSDRCDMGGAQ